MKNKLPQFIHKLFWDIDPESLNLKKDYFIIIERLLNYADDQSLKWLLDFYDKEKVKEVVKNSRKLTPKTANYWRKHFELKKDETKCMNIFYQKME